VLCEWIEAMEQFSFLEYYLARLGRWLCVLGRFDEAEEFAERARALQEERLLATADDGLWRGALARVHAHRGDLAEAERLAREGLAATEKTQWLNEQCVSLWDLAEVLSIAGRTDEAAATFDRTLERCARKQNLALAAQVRNRRDSLLG
jgi:tetratricopeptide (TPR) repeat protein